MQLNPYMKKRPWPLFHDANRNRVRSAYTCLQHSNKTSFRGHRRTGFTWQVLIQIKYYADDPEHEKCLWPRSFFPEADRNWVCSLYPITKTRLETGGGGGGGAGRFYVTSSDQDEEETQYTRLHVEKMCSFQKRITCQKKKKKRFRSSRNGPVLVFHMTVTATVGTKPLSTRSHHVCWDSIVTKTRRITTPAGLPVSYSSNILYTAQTALNRHPTTVFNTQNAWFVTTDNVNEWTIGKPQEENIQLITRK